MPFDATPITKTARVLLAAADLIERDGWVQGITRCHAGRCMIGAVSDAAPARFDLWPAIERINETLGRPFADPATVAYWNDAPGRTRDEVVALLRQAAAR